MYMWSKHAGDTGGVVRQTIIMIIIMIIGYTHRDSHSCRGDEGVDSLQRERERTRHIFSQPNISIWLEFNLVVCSEIVSMKILAVFILAVYGIMLCEQKYCQNFTRNLAVEVQPPNHQI